MITLFRSLPTQNLWMKPQMLSPSGWLLTRSTTHTLRLLEIGFRSKSRSTQLATCSIPTFPSSVTLRVARRLSAHSNTLFLLQFRTTSEQLLPLPRKSLALLYSSFILICESPRFVRRSRLPSVMSPGKRAGTTSNTTIPSKCSSAITPACLQDLYNIPIAPATNKSNSIGVFGMDDQFAEKVHSHESHEI